MIGLADQLGVLRRSCAEQDLPAFAPTGGIVAPREARRRGLSARKKDARLLSRLGLGREGHDRIGRRWIGCRGHSLTSGALISASAEGDKCKDRHGGRYPAEAWAWRKAQCGK